MQLGCAAYCGRVTVERFGWLDPHASALDFASGSGLALHVGLAMLTWGAWSAGCAAATAVQDHYAEWRWSPQAVRYCGP